MDDATKRILHSLNLEAKAMNKNIVQKSATMNDIPMQTEIYHQPPHQPPQPQPQHVPPPHQGQIPAAPSPAQQPLVQQVIQQDLEPLIERVVSLEKQVTKFVNLIERNVAKNAKEINIRIKLNENNDSTDSQ